jgi:hypothetical protein
MASIKWVENTLVSVKLRENLYTPGLLKRSPYIWFFDIRCEEGNWKPADFESVNRLFCVSVGRVVLQKLVVKKISDSEMVAPEAHKIPAEWIKPLQNTADWKVDNFPWRGGNLIELDPEVGSVDARVIKPSLNVTTDRRVIESCELTNLWGDQDLSDRLCRYFDTGVNRDDLKFEVFPGLWDDREKLRPLTRRLPVPFR